MGFSRRQFIAGCGALSVASLPSVFASVPERKIGVALLGLGNYSERLLAPALSQTKYCELKGIVTGTPAKIPRWQQRWQIPDTNCYTYDTLASIANNPAIDVIYVVTPTATHMDFVVKAAATGKHVWCEKPMAMTAKECQVMIDACKRNGVQLAIGYRMQHEPNTVAMARLTKSKPFGPLRSISSFAGYAGNGSAPSNWRMQHHMGGGALYDMGVYAINGARFVSNMEPIAVTGRHEKTHANFTEVDETTLFTMEFPNGVMADCGTSVVRGFNHLQLDCQDGWYRLEPMQSYSGVTATTSSGATYPPISAMQQTLQMDNDALAILGRGSQRVPGEEGMRDIHIVEAIFTAAKTQQRVLL